jgi:hypothetical protein
VSSASDFLDPHHFFAAFAAGTARYWRRRAIDWDRARPWPGDFNGRATRLELADRWDRMTARAQACRARAEIAELYGATDHERALIQSVAESLAVAA